MVELYVIIFTLTAFVFALIYEHGRELERVKRREYQKGFKKGLYYNVVRVCENNDLEVVDAYGKHYE